MKSALSILFFILFTSLYTQGIQSDRNLAMSFYTYKEYEKAEVFFDKIYDEDISGIFPYYYETLIKQKKYDIAVKITDKAIVFDKKNALYSFYKGKIYFLQKDTIASAKYWDEAVQKIQKNPSHTEKLISLFKELYQWNYVEKTIEMYRKKTKDDISYIREYIESLFNQEKYDQAINERIKIIDNTDNNYMQYLYDIQEYKDNKKLISSTEKAVYGRLSKEPSSEKWNKVAIWLSINMNDLSYAIQLAKAADRRTKFEKSSTMYVSNIAYDQKKYSIALDGYQFVISNSPYIESVKQAKNKEIEALYYMTDTMGFENENKKKLESLFEEYTAAFPISKSSAEIYMLKANYLVREKNDVNSAIDILDNIILNISTSNPIVNQAKMSKADFLLYKGKKWDASLLYGQVSEDEKDSPLGEEARFKNAKIFYYNGDYELAEELLSILKSSTTELIANDALYLAVFIEENKDDPFSALAMSKISKADLCFYQKNYACGFELLKEVQDSFRLAQVMDDVYLMEGFKRLEIGEKDNASDFFEKVFTEHPNSILADRALYEYGKIQEAKGEKEKAKKAYFDILKQHKDSVFGADVRTRIRQL